MDFQRLNAFSTYNKTGHALTQEPPPRGFEIYNVGRGFHAHHSYIFNLSEICLGVEKNCINLTVFTQNLSSLRVEGHEIYNFWSPSPTDATYQI